jgi:outer membrane protein assembly factor BamB
MAIANGVVYTLGTDAKFKEEYVIAIDEKKGTELWRLPFAPLYTYKGNAYGDGPRSTPTIDGNLLFALSGDGTLVCIDIKGRKELWKKQLVKDLGGVIMDKYGFSESPLVDGKQLICSAGGPKGAIVAFDKTNGNVLWRSKDMTWNATFGSAVVAEFHGKRQYVHTVYDGEATKEQGAVVGVSASDGKVLWWQTHFTGTNDGTSITPIVRGDLIYVSAGFGAGCKLLEINKAQKVNDIYPKKLAKKVKNTHGGMVLVGDHVYGHSEPSMWICQEFKTGAIEWDEKIQVKGVSGSIIAAEGMLYLYSDDGEVGLVNASPKDFDLVSKFVIPQKSAIPRARLTSRQVQIWSHPAIANGVLYLRDHEYIFAFAIK